MVAKPKDNTLTLKDIYFETGTTYRYFLNWRHALLAGYLVALYGLASGYIWVIENGRLNLSWVVFLSGLILSACFWGLERRIRDLYQSCTNAGAEIERKLRIEGIYSRLDSPKLRDKLVTHSRILNWLFGLIISGMFIGFICSLWLIFK
jgi:hypothetical protein